MTILENGKSLVTDVAKKSWLKRTSVSNYIHSLLQKWFITQTTTGKRISYIAESPEQILKDFEARKERFAKHLPELNSIFLNSSNTANIRFFEGKSWLRQIYREISTQFKPIMSFFSAEKFFEVLTMGDINEFIENIIKNDNRIEDLIEDTPFARKFMEGRNFAEKKINWLPKSFNMTIDLLIWGDSVAMISYDKVMGVIIENPEIADFHKNVFKHLSMTVEKK